MSLRSHQVKQKSFESINSFADSVLLPVRGVKQEKRRLVPHSGCAPFVFGNLAFQLSLFVAGEKATQLSQKSSFRSRCESVDGSVAAVSLNDEENLASV